MKVQEIKHNFEAIQAPFFFFNVDFFIKLSMARFEPQIFGAKATFAATVPKQPP